MTDAEETCQHTAAQRMSYGGVPETDAEGRERLRCCRCGLLHDTVLVWPWDPAFDPEVGVTVPLSEPTGESPG